MDSLWPVLASIASALLIPIAAALGILVTKKIQLASADMSMKALALKNDTHNQIKMVCETAVSAAEQLYKAGKLPASGRKQYAMDMANKILTGRKIQIAQDILDVYIEAQVACLDDSTSTTTTTTSPSDNTGGSTTTTTTNTNTVTPVTNINTNTTTPGGLG